MPIPLIFGIGAAAAAALGVGAGVKGGLKMKEANDSIKASEARNKRNIEQMEKRQGPAQQALESLGRSEKEIEKSFGEFANVFEKIKNRPKFSEIEDEKFLPDFLELLRQMPRWHGLVAAAWLRVVEEWP